jgi:hypothetical protein
VAYLTVSNTVDMNVAVRYAIHSALINSLFDSSSMAALLIPPELVIVVSVSTVLRGSLA